MTSGLDIAAAIAGLTKLLLDLIDLAASLRGSVSKCNRLKADLETLRKVLERVGDEYGKTVSLLQFHGSPGLQVVNSLLQRCIDDCSATCQEYSAVLNAVLTSKVRPWKWRSSQGDLAHAGIRLEANKSTLMICLSSISEERERIKASVTTQSPPPYQSSPQQPYAPQSVYGYPSAGQGYGSPVTSQPYGLPYTPQPKYPSLFKGQSAYASQPASPPPTVTPKNHHNCPPDCQRCWDENDKKKREEASRRHLQGLQHLCPSDCQRCWDESDRKKREEESRRHSKGFQHLCPSDCQRCWDENDKKKREEESRRHSQGLQHLCLSDCQRCWDENDKKKREEASRRHSQGLQHLCPSDCQRCWDERDWKKREEESRRHY